MTDKKGVDKGTPPYSSAPLGCETRNDTAG